MFRHSEIREMGSCTENAPQNDSDHSKTAFILGVLSTKCLVPVENSEPVFLSQMVRKDAVPSCSPELREHCCPQKAVAPLKAAQDSGSASAQLCSCFSCLSCC